MVSLFSFDKDITLDLGTNSLSKCVPFCIFIKMDNGGPYSALRVRTHIHERIRIEIRIESSKSDVHSYSRAAESSFSLSQHDNVESSRCRSRQSPAGQVTTGVGIRTAFWRASSPARPVR